MDRLRDTASPWDLVVVGGGASGLGTALDSASRGYRTLLLEQGDFAEGTSSRSTKLIHGGVRYLRQGRLGLVYKSLQERALLYQNAPHLVHPLFFAIPAPNLLNLGYLYAGMKLYDGLAGSFSLAPSRFMPLTEMHARFPSLCSYPLRGGVCFCDAQFDDARLAINLAQTVVEQVGTVLNYMKVTQLLKSKNRLVGLIAHDQETKTEYEILAKAIVNAAGTAVDSICRMDEADHPSSIVLSQGSHIVLDRSLFPTDYALVIPETSDHRLLFIIPWYQRVLIGTTDIPIQTLPTHPQPSEEEINYLLKTASPYLRRSATRSDICAAFAGIRALVKPKRQNHTARLSRDHLIQVSDSHLVTLLGGKWTTYRKIGEDAVDVAAQVAKLPIRPSQTAHLRIHGYTEPSSTFTPYQSYGSDAPLVNQLADADPQLAEPLHPDIPCRGVDVIWAVRHEMARQVDDVLSRRTRSTFLSTAASREVAPKVAALMAKELTPFGVSP
jgi:glycerol-3-phosphate dehydrogenase